MPIPKRTYRPHKYGIAPKAERTVGGIVYASKAEGRWSVVLDSLVRCNEVRGWLRQIKVPLGPDFNTIVDFLVFYVNPTDGVQFNEVKGDETPAFRQVRRLWPKYGPAPLAIIKTDGRGWSREIIQGRCPELET